VSRLEVVCRDDHRRLRGFIPTIPPDSEYDRKKNYLPEVTSAIEMLDVSTSEESELRRMIHSKVFETLQYPTMTKRYEAVEETYPETCEWIFHDGSEEQARWSNFKEWLVSSEISGVYWINGKVGSGKSTLMKHIFDDPRTRFYLEEWAQGIPLCLVTFFFWNSGTVEQRSQAGLLRGLLYQSLEQYPDLLPIILPDRWAKMYSNSLDRITSVPGPWSLRELFASFRALIQQRIVPLKLFLLIDGLDEFDGDHEELADLFKNLPESSSLKVCVSSRPWVVFTDNFSSYPSLRLQDLTYPDIIHFVNDKFRRSTAFSRLAEQKPLSAHALIQEVVEKADGVFLWVRLVVASLLMGIRNRDDIPVLEARLRLLPKELEPLYEHLLHHIGPIYLPWASKAFQIVRAAHQLGTRPFESSSELRNGFPPLTLGIMLLATCEEPDLATLSMTSRLNENALSDLTVHLIARCAGMLEVLVNNSNEDIGPEHLVVYLHRTVRDFLEKPAHWADLLSHTADTKFNPYVSLLKAHVIKVQIHIESHSPRLSKRKDRTRVRELARHVMMCAYRANMDTETHDTQTITLDYFNELLVPLAKKEDHWCHIMARLNAGIQPSSFFEIAALYNLTGYIGHNRSKVRNPSKLLHTLLPRWEWSAEDTIPIPTVEMASLLLRNGADPNFEYRGCSTWFNSLWYVFDSFQKKDQNSRSTQLSYVQIMKELVSYGADPTMQLFTHFKNSGLTSYSTVEIISRHVKPLFPNEADAILTELERSMPKHVFKKLWEELRDKEKLEKDKPMEHIDINGEVEKHHEDENTNGSDNDNNDDSYEDENTDGSDNDNYDNSYEEEEEIYFSHFDIL
jgi:hypothetical protein